MEASITDKILSCINLNYKNCTTISKEIDESTNRVNKQLQQLKKRNEITWILYSASDKQGCKGIKYKAK